MSAVKQEDGMPAVGGGNQVRPAPPDFEDDDQELTQQQQTSRKDSEARKRPVVEDDDDDSDGFDTKRAKPAVRGSEASSSGVRGCQSTQRRDSQQQQRKVKKSRLDDGSIVFELTAKRRVQVKSFRGRVMVDIREYYLTDDGDMRPGKKGLSLPLDQWRTMQSIMPDIEDAIEELK
eukprot:Clim_evm17s246 gene=Clim_evmTU17s246